MGILNNESEKAACVRRVQELSDQLARLETNTNALERQVIEAKAEAGAASLELENGKISRKQYEALARRVGELEAERSQKFFAAAAARKELAAAKEALFKATTAEREKEARKYANQRTKLIEELLAGYAQAWKARQRLHELNNKIASVFTNTITVRHDGTLLSTSEVDSALGIELARMCQIVPLPDATACPPLPGCKTFITGNAAAALPLSELIEQANATLVRRVVEGHQPAPEQPEAKPAPVAEPDIDDAILSPPSEPAQTFRADQIVRPAVKLTA